MSLKNKKGFSNQIMIIILAVIVLLLMVVMANNFFQKGSSSVDETFDPNNISHYASNNVIQENNQGNSQPGLIEES